MRKTFLVLLFVAGALSVHAQRCLDINILSLMSNLQAPGDAASCFGECKTGQNEHSQKVILNYGVRDAQLDEVIKHNAQDFTNASVSGISSANLTGSAQVQDYKAMAEKMKSMTPEQQKAFVMQMAQKMQNANHATTEMENPATAKLVASTQAIVIQLKQLGDEFAAKIRAIRDKEKAERDAVKQPDYSKCPGVDKEGLPACACVNGADGKYWQQIITIENKYNSQKNALLQSYLPHYKSLVGNIEDNISKLHHGDDVKTNTYKKMLFSAQSGAFGNAFDIPASVINDIRRSGADAYVNKTNCDAGVYNLSCEHQ